jgi:hypothetical protein
MCKVSLFHSFSNIASNATDNKASTPLCFESRAGYLPSRTQLSRMGTTPYGVRDSASDNAGSAKSTGLCTDFARMSKAPGNGQPDEDECAITELRGTAGVTASRQKGIKLQKTKS